jgi:hypothetical protein
MTLQLPQIEKEYKIMLIIRISIIQQAIPKKKLHNITIYKEKLIPPPPKKQKTK